ncbi:MAG: prolyl oligopeptidase family serine peptidase [Egibacteraceae bacterium]
MSQLAYPPTRRGDVVDDHHGTRIADPYRWLEDVDAPEVREWIAAQNALTESWLADHRGDAPDGRARISGRLTELWDHPRAGAPWRRGARWFQLRNTGLQDQDVLWTMAAPDDLEGRVLLDPNTLSPDGTVALAATALSADGALLAHATSVAGSDWMTWRVRDVETAKDRDDVLEWSKFTAAAWTHDGVGFFYGVYDPPAADAVYEQRNLNQRLHYHRLGDPQAADRLVIARPDQPEWVFGPSVTYDGRWLIVHVWQGTDRRNRIWLADLAVAEASPRPLIDEFDAGYRVVGSDGDVLYVLTDLDAPRGRIVAVDVREPERARWREVVPEASDTLEDARVVGGRLVAVYLHHASHRIRVFDLDGRPAGEVPLGALVSVTALTGREDDRAFCFTSAGFTHSTAVLRHDLDSGDTATIRPAGVALRGYVTEQVFVTSKGGTSVPMFLVHREGLAPAPDGQVSGEVPTLLWGYGGFNIAVTPMCSLPWLVWLELGGLLAVANLRGGGEYGEAWHDAGRLANKQNVFDDFIACAEWLIAARWTRAGRLGTNGGSNGGLLVGACMTQRPDLFGACLPEVGVFDMLRFHKFTIGWAWESEYGCASDPEQFKTLLAYSPLHNLRPQTAYPPTLVVTGDHDDRVVPGHSLKFAAALQAAQASDAPALLRVETSTGHGGSTPTSKLIAQRADVLAFLARALGVS